MTTIKVLAVAFGLLLAFLASTLTGVDVRDIMTITSFIAAINLLVSKWVSVIYMREVLKGTLPRDKE